MRGRVVASAAAVAAGSLLTVSSAAADTSYPRATANVRVEQSTSPLRNFIMPQVAVDPKDPFTVAVVAGDFDTGQCTLYISRDGGTTFHAARTTPKPSQFQRCTPNVGAKAYSIVWLPNGTLLVGMYAFNGNAYAFSGPTNIVLAATSDLGQTWRSTVVVNADKMATDSPSDSPYDAWQMHMAADPSGKEIVFGWSHGSHPWISVSTDGGATFAAPVDAKTGDGPHTELSDNGGGVVAVAPDDTIFVLYPEQPPDPTSASSAAMALQPNLRVAKSTDHGQTFTHSTAGPRDLDFTLYPEMAVTPNRSGGGYSVVIVTEDIADGAAKQQQVRDVYAYRSTDGGTTWQPRVRISDDNVNQDLANKMVPNVSVAPSGRVDAAWQDFRNNDGNYLTDVYYAFSNDGGATWSRNVRVSDVSSNRHYGNFANYGDVKGPVGLASNNNTAYFSWDDTRNATYDVPAVDAYYAAVQLAPITVTASTGATLARGAAAVLAGLIVAGIALLLIAMMQRRRAGGPRAQVPPSTSSGVRAR